MSTDTEGKYLDRASLLARIEELEAIATAAMNRADASICSYCEKVIAAPPDAEATRAHMDVCSKHPASMLREQVATLTKQFVDASNDAARAELRAHELAEDLKAEGLNPEEPNDSDARLRALMRRVLKLTAKRLNAEDALDALADVIDEAFAGGGA